MIRVRLNATNCENHSIYLYIYIKKTIPRTYNINNYCIHSCLKPHSTGRYYIIDELTSRFGSERYLIYETFDGSFKTITP